MAPLSVAEIGAEKRRDVFAAEWDHLGTDLRKQLFHERSGIAPQLYAEGQLRFRDGGRSHCDCPGIAHVSQAIDQHPLHCRSSAMIADESRIKPAHRICRSPRAASSSSFVQRRRAFRGMVGHTRSSRNCLNRCSREPCGGKSGDAIPPARGSALTYSLGFGCAG